MKTGKLYRFRYMNGDCEEPELVLKINYRDFLCDVTVLDGEGKVTEHKSTVKESWIELI